MKEAIPYKDPDTTFDMNKLKRICGIYEINSFLKPQFLNTFKNIGNGQKDNDMRSKRDRKYDLS